MSDLTISFVLYNTGEAEILRAVDQALASMPNARVVLIDNSPVYNPIPALPDGVTVIRPGKNLGYGAGHNRALALSRDCQYHAVLNTDLVYGPEVMPELLRFMDSHPDVGLAMPRVTYPDGSIQYLCRNLPHPFDIFGRGFLPNSKWTKLRNDKYEYRDWNYDSVAEFPFLSGCFMMLRRAAIDKVGAFDERFFMYGEDVDLSRRIARNWRTMFVPSVTVQHEYRSQAGGVRRKVSKIVNLSRYFAKWGWWNDRERDELNHKARHAVGMDV